MMIEPAPCSRMIGIAARLARIDGKTLTSSAACQSSSVLAMNTPPRPPPTQFTSTSSRPNARCASLTSRSGASTSVRSPSKAIAVEGDLTEADAPERLVNEAYRAFGRLDVLVNCVGGGRGGVFMASTDEDWQAALDVNVFPSIRASRAAIPIMREQGDGSIVIISSIYGREIGPLPTEAPAFSAPYHLAKMAEINLGKAMARELAPWGIRVNTVAPGSILFPGGSWARRTENKPEK